MKNFYQCVNKAGLVLAAVTFVSCASKQTVTTSKSRSGLDKYNNGYEMEKGDHGMMQAGSSKVSQYDRKGTNLGSKHFSGKDYNKENYRTKVWGGDKGYAVKKYGGKTDGSKFKHSPHYVSRDKRAQGEGQFATANNSKFKVGQFTGANSNAHERRANDVKTGTSGYVTSRNKAPEPLIMSREDYNQLNIRETRKLLGRQ